MYLRETPIPPDEKPEGVEVIVLDVVFNGFSYLGEMTQEEFYGPGVTKEASNG